MDRAQFNKWWLEYWGKYIGDVPDGQTEPIGHLNRYLRGGYPKLQRNVRSAVFKAGLDHWWLALWGKYVNTPAGKTVPSGSLIKYLRNPSTYPVLARAAQGAVAAELKRAIAGHEAKPHAGGYTDAQARKAVKDKL